MHGVEDLGLLKMDFLGLRNLDVITDAVEMISEPRASPTSTSTPVPSTTPRRSSCSQRGDSHRRVPARRLADARAACGRWRRRSFDDVAALVALYRPGPMAANMHNDYADRKNGRKPIEYFHPDARGAARRHATA